MHEIEITICNFPITENITEPSSINIFKIYRNYYCLETRVYDWLQVSSYSVFLKRKHNKLQNSWFFFDCCGDSLTFCKQKKKIRLTNRLVKKLIYLLNNLHFNLFNKKNWLFILVRYCRMCCFEGRTTVRNHRQYELFKFVFVTDDGKELQVAVWGKGIEKMKEIVQPNEVSVHLSPHWQICAYFFNWISVSSCYVNVLK